MQKEDDYSSGVDAEEVKLKHPNCLSEGSERVGWIRRIVHTNQWL
jgi:hypothetical protein